MTQDQYTNSKTYAPQGTDAGTGISPGDILVSRFHPVRKKGDKVIIADAVPLSVIANELRSDPQLQAQTLSVRPLKTLDKPEYDKVKKRLACVVPASSAGSGVPWAKLDIQHHTGLFGFDIDKGVTDARALLEVIKATPGAVMAGLSIGGADLWCIFAGPTATTLSEYKGLWLAITQGFPENLRATSGDESNHFNRARTLAHDPDVWLAESVIPLEVEAAPTGRGRGKPQDLKGILDLLDVPQERNDWLSLLHILKAAGLAMEDVEAWSSRGEKYRDGEVEEAWDGLEPEETKGEALAKLKRLAGKNGVGKPGTYVLGDRTLIDDLMVIRRAMSDRGREFDDEGAPRLFSTNGQVSRMAETEIIQLDHLALIDDLSTDSVWVRLRITEEGKVTSVSAAPCVDALRTAVTAHRDRAGLPELNTIVHQPLVLSCDDGYRLVETPGYIPEAGVLSRVPEGLQGMDLEVAKAVLNDAFGIFETGANRPEERTGFRFTDEQAAVNATACLFTPMLRHADRSIIPPMFAATKIERVTGATTFLQAVSMLTTGTPLQVITWGKSAAELEKAIGALFIKGSPIIFFDNVLDPAESSLLSTLISEGDSSTRLLGKSYIIRNRGPVTLMMSANTTSIGEDYAQRICQIDLDWGAPRTLDDELDNAFRHNPYLPWLADHKVIVLSAMCAVLRAALLRLPLMKQQGKSRFPVWERWANAILQVLEMPPVQVGILTENLATPGAVRQDLLNGLIQKAAKVGRVEKLKRDSIVYAFDDEGYDPSQLPGVDALEEPPGGFGAVIPGGEVIMWDRKNGAQEFGTWLNQLVRAKFAVWWDKKRWSLRATDGKGVRREYWISADKE